MGTYFDPAVGTPPPGTLLVAEQECNRCGHANSWACAPTSSNWTRAYITEVVYQVHPELGNCECSPLGGGHATCSDIRAMVPGVRFAVR